ncbi:hypothetical protein [Sphingomonas sp.]|jgi:hypothetical protein
MSWRLRFTTQTWIACEDDGQVEGFSIRVTWFAWEIEVCFGRHNGRLR